MGIEVMPTKTEFKFNCPTCGQHILTATEWSGRRINCPACQTKITVPAPPKEAKKPAPVTPYKPATHPNYTSRVLRVELPVKGSKAAAIQAQGATASPKTSPDVQPATGGRNLKSNTPPAVRVQPQQLRVAVLTPEIKLDMVRAVRRRIADPSAWLPDGIKGAYTYAAKVSNGETVLVDVKSPEATRFSLIGAFLLEFHLRQVVRTAIGREKLLDQEIPDAIHEVLAENVSDEVRERIEHSPAKENLMNLSHPQCLATLDVLEECYSQRMDFVRAETAKQFLGSVRLPDLVKKLERKARVTPEEVATALYLELMDVRRRLDRLESRIARDKQGAKLGQE